MVARKTGDGFVVAWSSRLQDGSGLGIYAQRYSPTAARQGTEFRVNTVVASHQSQPAVGGLGDGGFAVVWASKLQDGSGLGVYAHRYDATGNAEDVEFRVNTTIADDQSQPVVARLAVGGWVAVWTSFGQDGSLEGVYGQRF